MNSSKTITENSNWNQLFRIGGFAPLVTLILYLVQLLTIIFSSEPYPVTPQDWFALFQRNPFLGLIFLNALDVFSIAILGLMFLALYIALRRVNPALMLVVIFFAFLGITVFVSSRTDMVTATLALTEQYAAATTEAQSSQILAAEQAIMVLSRGTPETIGFFFIAIASLIISVVMLRSDPFRNYIGYLSILGFIITVINQICVIFAPSIAAILLPINGLIWLIWWILVGVRLIQLGKES